MQSQFICWAFMRSWGRWQRRLISIETQRAPSHRDGADSRVRIEAGYMSQFRKLEARELRKLRKQNVVRGALPFRLPSLIRHGGGGCPGFATPRKKGAPLATPPPLPTKN